MDAALPGLIFVGRVARRLRLCNICLCLPPSSPAAAATVFHSGPAPPLSITAYQGAVAGSEHLRTLGKFHARPLIKNVPFHFFPQRTFEVPPSTCKPGRPGLLLLSCTRCNLIKTDAAGLKAERLFDGVCLSRGSLRLGVRDRCAVDVSAEYLQDGCCKGGGGLPPIEQKPRAHVFFISGTAGIYSVCSEPCSISHWLRHSLA